MEAATAEKAAVVSRGGCIINRAVARRYAFWAAKRQHRDGVITRISDEVISALAEQAMRTIAAMVQHHPSGMRTLKPF